MSPPRPVDLALSARWILPIEPAGTLVDHVLVVDGGRIVALVSARRSPSATTRRASGTTSSATCSCRDW